MLTPKFDINQSDQFVTLYIHAPYTKVSEAEITILEDECTFYLKPYLLRLCFPGEVAEEGSTCNYDADAGNYILNVKKANHGEVFENLDLLTTLLNKKSSDERRPLIEVVSHKVELPDVEKTFSVSWTEKENLCDVPSYGFGFANKQQNISVLETFTELLSLDDPSKTSTNDRRLLRIEREEEKFDSDHYLADLYEDDLVMEVLNYQPWWNDDCEVIFDEQEKEVLRNLPNKEYLLDEIETKLVFMGPKWLLIDAWLVLLENLSSFELKDLIELRGLVDILFGYAYNVRATEDDNSVESSWTIRTLSSTLSCCDTARSVNDQLIASYRRMLCYPQHRSWKLAEKLQIDVATILRRGQRCVLKCLLQTLTIFRTADTAPCYLLNDLYINDYCVWIQHQPRCDVTLISLARVIENTKIFKSDAGFELELIEEAATLVLKEQGLDSNSESLVDGLNSLAI